MKKEADKQKHSLVLQDVRVDYRSYLHRPTSLKEAFLRGIKERNFKYYSTFPALININLNLEKGTVLGIIGSNGSGKSTLLKVISGVLTPTAGVVKQYGTVASLIELGAGFDSELNAIENIYLNWSLYRKSRLEIKNSLEQIISFAQLQDFKEMPIKHYSSGMYARLGFSTAIHLDPDILVVDEIIAVGDEVFQAKCFKEMKKFKKRGKSIVFVSHSMEQIINICDQVVLLEKGKNVFQGNPKKAVEAYRAPNYHQSLSA